MLQAPLATAVAPSQQAMHSGFDVWTPSAPPAESDFQLTGSDFSQVLELTVGPGELITSEPHSMLFMTSGIEMDADMGDVGQACARGCAGESFFRLKFRNTSNGQERLALTPNFPAKIVPIDLSLHSGLAMHKGAFLGAKGDGWTIRLERVRGMAACCCGGQGMFLNRLHGEGMAFLSAGGTVMMKELAEGEEVVIDRHSLLAMERTVALGIRRTGNCMVCCCGDQGLFNVVLTGPGWVMIQSMPLSKLKAAVGPAAGAGANGNAGGGGGAGAGA
mmetsp:Transcript_6193/g.14807  ORF Transcript_6193/g.14807 Transcript_6193/m.14807 type:complete len:275 (+) Transcript_6193:79-903(+)